MVELVREETVAVVPIGTPLTGGSGHDNDTDFVGVSVSSAGGSYFFFGEHGYFLGNLYDEPLVRAVYGAGWSQSRFSGI